MTLLLDTHVALWAITGDATLAPSSWTAYATSQTSSLSGHSVGDHHQAVRGKLAGPPDLAERVGNMGFRELPVTHAHAIAAGRLPPHHRDPFDRMLVAQAITESLTLATRDASIALYDVDVLKV